jgi:hypothetical protein
MIQFIVFALYLCLGVTALIAWPVIRHPTLPARRKLLISTLVFLTLVPLALLLYAFLGAPQMAGS